LLKQREILDEAVDLLDQSNQGDSPETAAKRIRAAQLNSELIRLKNEAIERGKDPRNRAVECGRSWKDGDGF
jgi:hypothetical protein